jgi:Lipase (class 3)
MTARNLTQALGSSWYGNVWLTLATIAYTDDASSQIVNVTADLPVRVKNMAAMPAMQDGSELLGQWSADWGPVYTTTPGSINANLMYVASYSTSSGPLFTAVCIRGTDTAEDDTPGGLWTQLAEDLKIGEMVNWQDVLANNFNPALLQAGPGLPAAIAHGSAQALGDLLSFQWPATNGAGVVDYLKANVPASVPIIVTGHSLGGCQALVMALYLANALPGYSIIPHPFAPPSPGNQAWCDLYKAAFPLGTGQIWWNTADIVPNVFQVVAGNTSVTTASLTNLSNMWGPAYQGNLPIGDLNDGVTYFKNLANGAYINLINDLGAGFVQTLNGQYLQPVSSDPSKKQCQDDWLTQLELQHFPPMYFSLIAGQLPIPAFAPPPLPNPPPTCTLPNGGVANG